MLHATYGRVDTGNDAFRPATHNPNVLCVHGHLPYRKRSVSKPRWLACSCVPGNGQPVDVGDSNNSGGAHVGCGYPATDRMDHRAPSTSRAQSISFATCSATSPSRRQAILIRGWRFGAIETVLRNRCRLDRVVIRSSSVAFVCWIFPRLCRVPHRG